MMVWYEKCWLKLSKCTILLMVYFLCYYVNNIVMWTGFSSEIPADLIWPPFVRLFQSCWDRWRGELEDYGTHTHTHLRGQEREGKLPFHVITIGRIASSPSSVRVRRVVR